MSNHNMSGVARRRRKRSLLRRDGDRCCHCGHSFSQEQLTIEHVKPHSLGGPNALHNLRLACWACNNRRGASPLIS
jgi:5-methylcytosine-specific restriction endonuclease McrA